MKKLITMALVLTMGLTIILTGCAPKEVPPSPGDDVPGTESAIKDTLIWAQGTDVFSMDPHIGKETTAIQVTGQIYDTLLTVNGKMEVLPMLAKEWTRVDDLNYEFVLRDDVYFHDGTKFTSADAKFSLDRAIASPQVAYIVDFIDKVEILDEYKIKLTTKEPYAPTFLNLTHPASGIVSKSYCESNPEALKTKPMGTGPYVFGEWKQGDYVKLTANEKYWAGAPQTKNLTMRIIPENAQRTIALELGEVDIAYDILPNDVPKVKENTSLVMFEEPALTSFTIAMNHQSEKMADPLVREAIRVAIDPQSIVDAVYYGAAEVANSMVPSGAFGFQKDAAKIEYNPERAKELLKQAGKEKGLKLQLFVNDNQARIEICQIVQSQLKEVGIDCEVQVLEFAAFINKIDTPTFDMCLSGWTTSTADADYTYFAQFHSSKFGSQGNRVFVEIPGVDVLLEKGRSSGSPEERMAAYKQVEELLTQYSVNRPLLYTTVNAGASNKVQGFEIIPNGYHKYYGVTVNK